MEVGLAETRHGAEPWTGRRQDDVTRNVVEAGEEMDIPCSLTVQEKGFGQGHGTM